MIQDLLNDQKINLYIEKLEKSGLPPQNIISKLASIERFILWAKRKGYITDEKRPIALIYNAQNKYKIHTDNNTNEQILTQEKKEFQPVISVKRNGFLNFFSPAVVVSFFILGLIVGSGFFLFYYFAPKQTVNIADKTSSGRTILFQGKLTDSLGNTIKTRTKIAFTLYDQPIGGREVYKSGECTIKPEQSGIFVKTIGKECGREIPHEIFLYNSRLYLGITVGKDTEMTPRQQIGTVEYASESTKVQGYPIASYEGDIIEATGGATINTIPIINQYGNLIIAQNNPKIWSTSGNFEIRGEALTFSTDEGSAGNINLSPDAGGNTIVTAGNLGVGTAQPSSFPLEVAGAVGPHEDSLYDLGSPFLRWNKLYVREMIGGPSGILGHLQRNGTNLSPSSVGDNLLLGATATQSAQVKLAGTKDESSFIATGNFGIGTRTPQEELTLSPTSYFVSEMASPTNITVQTGSGGSLTAGTYYFKIVAYDGVGTTSPSAEVSCSINGSSRTRCSLGWDSVSGATSYRVYKGSTLGGQNLYQNVSGTSYNYDSDTGSTTSTVPPVTTAYTNKLSPTGNSWMLGGNIGFGTATPTSGKIHVKGSNSVLLFIENTGTGNSIEDDNGAKLTAAGVFTDASDSTKKKDINDLPYGLSDLLTLRPVSYLWRENNMPDIGFIAQEVREKIPELVYGVAGNLSMSYGHMSALIVKAIQEQQQLITSLQSEVANIQHNLNGSREEKIVSPLAQIEKLDTKEAVIETIMPQESNITIDLSPDENSSQNTPQLAQFVIKGLTKEPVATIDAEGNASLSGTLQAENISAEIATTSALYSDTITAQTTQTQDLSAGTATISGALTASTVEAGNIKKIEEDSLDFSNKLNEIQSTLAKLREEPFYNEYADEEIAPAEAIVAENVSGNSLDSLTVLGQANLYDASIAHSLVVGSFFFSDNSLLSLASELKVSALEQINFFEGAVLISKDGNITTNGIITAQKIKTDTVEPQGNDFSVKLAASDGEKDVGNFKILNSQNDEVARLTASGEGYFKQGIAVSKHLVATSSANLLTSSENFEENGVYAPAIKTSSETAGVAIIPAKSSEVVLYSSRITEGSLVYITPTSPTYGKSLFVGQKRPCTGEDTLCKRYFTIAIESPVKNDIKFNWWIIN